MSKRVHYWVADSSRDAWEVSPRIKTAIRQVKQMMQKRGDDPVRIRNSWGTVVATCKLKYSKNNAETTAVCKRGR